ncbi:hypothetical protein [Bifidobacterium lemurum]|uniref:hypothetical protein n=1 Tax=Bifidobacterium lemurum TaxID=1603886 RepID=UPI000932A970|nr:hypothetical protein [Bifidobacterium lemurum]QOL35545.1 hypothetical protein BL8807_10515 [Bifidobacterium lemurum]
MNVFADGDHPELIKAYATVKRACAAANAELGLLSDDKATAIAGSTERSVHSMPVEHNQITICGENARLYYSMVGNGGAYEDSGIRCGDG